MAFILGELIVNDNDILLPRTVTDQVAISASKNLTQKLNEIDANVKSVTDEVTSARNAFPNLKERIDSIELTANNANNTANNVKAEVEGARGGQQTLNDRLDNMANEAVQAQQTATAANGIANDVKQEIDNAKDPNGTLKEKIDGIDNKFDRYLPLTGGTITGVLEVNGDLTTGRNQVWHEGNFNPATKRDNLAPTNGAYHQGTPLISADGTMDIGSTIDFHATGGSQTDYDVRVKSVGGEQLELTGTLISGRNNGYNIGVQGARFSTGEFETTFTDRVDTRAGDLKLRGQGGGANIVAESTFIPDSDGHKYLGTTDRKWNSVWATNGTIQTSDERYKTDIQDIDDELFFEMVKGVNVNTYVMLNERKDKMTKKELNSKENKQSNANAERVQVGIIAQDMAQFDCGKYILVHDEESDIYSINNYNFTSAIMAALKVEIQKREELEKRVEALENLIAQAQ